MVPLVSFTASRHLTPRWIILQVRESIDFFPARMSWWFFIYRILIDSHLPSWTQANTFNQKSRSSLPHANTHAHSAVHCRGSRGFNIYRFWHTRPQVKPRLRSKHSTSAAINASVIPRPTHLHQCCHSNNLSMLEAQTLNPFLITEKYGNQWCIKHGRGKGGEIELWRLDQDASWRIFLKKQLSQWKKGNGIEIKSTTGEVNVWEENG